MLLLTLSTFSVAQPYKGWTQAKSGESLKLTRRFPAGTLTLYALPETAAESGNAKHWLESRITNTMTGYKVVRQRGGIQDSGIKDSYFVVREVERPSGHRALSLLMACPIDGRNLRILETLGTEELFTDKTAATQLALVSAQLCAAGNLSIGSKPAVRRESERVATQAPTGPLPPAEIPPGLKQLQGIVTYGIQPGGLFGPTSDVIALFNDGSYTSDLATTFNEGIRASKGKSSKKWGHWRMKGSDLELKSGKDHSFSETSGNWKTIPGERDQRLNGCYGNLTTSSGGYSTGAVTVGKARTWCFYRNGRFTHDASTFGTAPHVTASSKNKTQQGRYRIDGYAIRLVYDDGTSASAAFSFLNDDRTHIGINGKRFMGGD